MIENTNTKQFYPGPILNDTLEISEFLFNTAEQIKIKHSKLDEDGVLRDIDLVYGQDYEVLKDEALTCDDGSEPPSHAHIMEMSLTASTGQITLKEHIHVIAGERLTAYRESAIIQDKNYPRTGAFPAATHEGALDYLTMQNQEQQDELDRALKAPISTQNFAGSMPLPIPGRALKINQDGSGFEMSEFDPDIALTTTENFRNESQQFATEASQSASAAKNSETIAGQKVNEINALHRDYMDEINTTSTNYLNQINSRSNKIIKDADAIINRVGLNMFDTVVKDHALTYPDGQGLALQGTWVYRDAKAGERYGYPDFYNTCVKEFKESTQVSENNITVTGTITNNNGVISGFSDTNYAILNQTPSSVTSFEIVFKCTTSDNIAEQVVFGQGTTTNRLTPQVGISASNKWYFNFSNDAGASWQSISSPYTVQPNTTYWLKFVWDGANAKAFSATQKDNYTLLGTKPLTENLEWSTTIQVGGDQLNTIYWQGSIDLNECYIDLNGSRWWDGVRLRRHSNGHFYYPISAKAFYDTRFNNQGAAWYYGVDEVNKRIFMPRNNWFMQMASSNPGSYTEAGIPDHTHTVSAFYWSTAGSVAEEGRGNPDYGRNETRTTSKASASSSVYGKSSTVQPKSIKHLLYICVGNQVVDSSHITVITEVEEGTKDIQEATQEGLVDIEDIRVKALSDLDTLYKQSLSDLDNTRVQSLSELSTRRDDGLIALSNASDALRQTQITNCIKELPQRIKCELDENGATLVAGSVITVPYGVEDLTEQYQKGMTFINDNFIVYDTKFANGKFFVWAEVTKNISLAKAGTPTSSNTIMAVNLDSVALTYCNTPTAHSGVDHLTDTTGYKYYETTTNTMWGRGALTSEYAQATASLPIFTFERQEGVITGILKIFNGLSFMGSTVFVDKELVCLIPYGRNFDGSLISIEHKTQTIGLLTADAANWKYNIVIDLSKKEGVFLPTATSIGNSRYYDVDENFWYTEGTNGKGGKKAQWCLLGGCVTDENKTITSINLVQAFAAVNSQQIDGPLVPTWVQLSSAVAITSSTVFFDMTSILPNDGHSYLIAGYWESSRTDTGGTDSQCRIMDKDKYVIRFCTDGINQRHTVYFTAVVDASRKNIGYQINAAALSGSVIAINSYRRLGITI